MFYVIGEKTNIIFLMPIGTLQDIREYVTNYFDHSLGPYTIKPIKAG